MGKTSPWLDEENGFQITPPRKFFIRRFTEFVLKVRAENSLNHEATDQRSASFSSTSIPHYVNSDGENGSDDLYLCVRPLLRFGRVIGLIPISGLFHATPDLEFVTFSPRSLASVTTILVISIMILHAGVRTILAGFLFRAGGASDTMQIAENVASVIFAISGGYVYYFTYCSASQFINCLYAWRSYKSVIPDLVDNRLSKHTHLVAGSLLISAVVQNALTHWNVLPGSRASNLTLLETYYNKHFPKYSDVLAFNPIITMGLFICDKWCVYAWTFADLLVAVIARAIYKQFQLHYETVNRDLARMKHDRHFWSRILEEHESIVQLLNKFNECFRPLIFSCVASNIYFIAITLNRFLVTSSTAQIAVKEHERSYLILLQQVNSVWSFLQLLAKTFTTIVCCARVHEHAHKMEDILWQCPIVGFNKEVERAELKLRTMKIGFTGLDYFTITKPFILTVFNVVFTFEIVLLQSAATSMASTNSSGSS